MFDCWAVPQGKVREQSSHPPFRFKRQSEINMKAREKVGFLSACIRDARGGLKGGKFWTVANDIWPWLEVLGRG